LVSNDALAFKKEFDYQQMLSTIDNTWYIYRFINSSNNLAARILLTFYQHVNSFFSDKVYLFCSFLTEHKTSFYTVQINVYIRRRKNKPGLYTNEKENKRKKNEWMMTRSTLNILGFFMFNKFIKKERSRQDISYYNRKF
jgi:hypothetical protein